MTEPKLIGMLLCFSIRSICRAYDFSILLRLILNAFHVLY